MLVITIWTLAAFSGPSRLSSAPPRRASLRGPPASGLTSAPRRASVRMSDADDDSADGAPQRMSIKVSGPTPILARLATACRMEGGVKRGLTGVVYGLEDGRIEIVCEGKRVDQFKTWASKFVEQACAQDVCEFASVTARGLDTKLNAMHTAQFQVVNFDKNTRRVLIRLKGDRQFLDYTLRHTKIEAGYNRKLEWEGRLIDDDQLTLELDVKGPAQQLKSFVRWCKRGPPMQRPEAIAISWVDETPIDEAEAMSTAFRDESVL